MIIEPLTKNTTSEILVAKESKLSLYFKGLGLAILTFLLFKSVTIIVLIFLGCMLAVTLDPLVARLEKLKLSRRVAVGLVAFGIVCLLLLFALMIIPEVLSQVNYLMKNIGSIREEIILQISGDSNLKAALVQLINRAGMSSADFLVDNAGPVIKNLMEGATEFGLVLIFTVYLLFDGRRAYRWICDFFAAPTRLKLDATANEASVVIHNYVSAQIVTSVIYGIYVFFVLKALGIPAALTLAVTAGVLDVLPVIGFFMSLAPALVLALTVSPGTAFWVCGFYFGYRIFSTYVLGPLLYGKKMNVSSLIVMVALLIAGTVGGVLWALAILPIVASYPIIERIWLVKYLGRKVIAKHADAETEDVMPDQVSLWNIHPPTSGQRQLSSLSSIETVKTFRRKILIVDDDDDIRTMLADILEVEGYIVLAASNGQEGHELLQMNPDTGLILLDLMMPVMDGQTFLRVLKKIPALSRIPVVMLSSSIDGANTEGAVEVLRKPSEIDLVLSVVAKHFRKTCTSPAKCSPIKIRPCLQNRSTFLS